VDWLDGASSVGVTAGASAPEVLVQEVIATLDASGINDVKLMQGREENIVFPLPKALQ